MASLQKDSRKTDVEFVTYCDIISHLIAIKVIYLIARKHGLS